MLEVCFPTWSKSVPWHARRCNPVQAGSRPKSPKGTGKQRQWGTERLPCCSRRVVIGIRDVWYTNTRIRLRRTLNSTKPRATSLLPEQMAVKRTAHHLSERQVNRFERKSDFRKSAYGAQNQHVPNPTGTTENLQRRTKTGKNELQWMSNAYNHSTCWRTWVLLVWAVKCLLAISRQSVARMQPSPNQFCKHQIKEKKNKGKISAFPNSRSKHSSAQDTHPNNCIKNKADGPWHSDTKRHGIRHWGN